MIAIRNRTIRAANADMLPKTLRLKSEKITIRKNIVYAPKSIKYGVPFPSTAVNGLLPEIVLSSGSVFISLSRATLKDNPKRRVC